MAESTLVNNAGISHIGKLEATTEQDFDRVLEVNVKGFYNCRRLGAVFDGPDALHSLGYSWGCGNSAGGK